MLRSKNHVFLARRARQINESIRIELCWIEPFWQLAILRFGDAAGRWPHDGPGCFDTGERVGTPVDEHAEFCSPIPSSAIVSEGRGKSYTGDEWKGGCSKRELDEVAASCHISIHLGSFTARPCACGIREVCLGI